MSSTSFRITQAVVGLAFGLALAGCEKITAPTPRCQLTVTMAQNTIGASGGSGTLVVTTPAECSWTVTTNVNWITNLSPTSGQGNADIRFQVAPNSSPNPRSGQITLNEINTALAQAGASCQYAIAPTNQNLGSAGATGVIAVTAPSECAWTATSNASWLVVLSGGSGQGNGNVSYSVAANTGSIRAGQIIIGDRIFSVSQTGSCALTLSPTSQNLGAGAASDVTITVTTSPGCTWTATTQDSWISLAPPADGIGSGSVRFSVTANTGAARTGRIAVEGVLFTVNQASGCVYSLGSTSASFTSAAQSGGPVTVTTTAGCTWTAVANAPWITVVTGATGSGNGTVTFQIADNSTGSARTGTITIAGITFTVNQS